MEGHRSTTTSDHLKLRKSTPMMFLEAQKSKEAAYRIN
jgi:hypothetical protein